MLLQEQDRPTKLRAAQAVQGSPSATLEGEGPKGDSSDTQQPIQSDRMREARCFGAAWDQVAIAGAGTCAPLVANERRNERASECKGPYVSLDQEKAHFRSKKQCSGYVWERSARCDPSSTCARHHMGTLHDDVMAANHADLDPSLHCGPSQRWCSTDAACCMRGTQAQVSDRRVAPRRTGEGSRCRAGWYLPRRSEVNLHLQGRG